MNAENAANDRRDSPGLTWAADLGDERSVPAVIHLSEDRLFVNFAFWTQVDRDEVVRSLENNQAPEAVFGRGTHMIVLAEINELRFSHALNLLEIYHGERNRRYEIQSPRDSVHFWLYSALRERLAPATTPESGFVSRSGAISVPVWGLVIALVTGALFSFWAAIARPDPHNEGRAAATKDLIERFLYRIGFTGTAVIASGVILGFVCWAIYRWRHPPLAEVIKIARPKESAAGV
jgi:hypothetical protein